MTASYIVLSQQMFPITHGITIKYIHIETRHVQFTIYTRYIPLIKMDP